MTVTIQDIFIKHKIDRRLITNIQRTTNPCENDNLMVKRVNDMNGISQNRKHKFEAQLGTTIYLPGKSLVSML